MKKISVLDFLVMPVSFYKKINDNIPGIILSIIIIGIADLGIYIYGSWGIIFINKPINILVHNLGMMIMAIILMGGLKLLLFSYPLYDLFKKFRLEVDYFDISNRLVKIIKIYAIAHLFFLIMELILYVSVINSQFLNQPIAARLMIFYISFIIPIWFSGIITRGIRSIYIFQEKFIGFLFIIIFIWNFLINLALGILYKYFDIIFK